MPQIGHRCPGLNEKHTFKSGHCVHTCDHPCLPIPVLIHIESKMLHDVHQGEYISATALQTCPRKLVLERTINYYVEPPKNWFSIRGTLIHKILEQPGLAAIIGDIKSMLGTMIKRGEIKKNKDEILAIWAKLEAQLYELAAKLPTTRIEDWFAEVEYSLDLGVINGKPRKLMGTIDILRPRHKSIEDYKSMGDRGLGIIKRGPKKDHVKQVSIYRLLAEDGTPTDPEMAEAIKLWMNGDLVKIENGRIYYMTMMKVVATGAPMTENTGFLKSEPQITGQEISRQWLGERKDVVLKRGKRRETADPLKDYELSVKTNWEITYLVPEVELEDKGETLAYVKEKAKVLFDAFDGKIVAPMCEPETRQWLCDFCPVEIRKACDAQNEKDGVQRIVEVQDDVPVEA